MPLIRQCALIVLNTIAFQKKKLVYVSDATVENQTADDSDHGKSVFQIAMIEEIGNPTRECEVAIFGSTE